VQAELATAGRHPTHGDNLRIFVLRSLRAFGFGFLGVLLALYLERFGFGAVQIGLYLSLATLGGIGTNFAFSRLADRSGRRRILALAGALFALTGVLLAGAQGPVWLLMAALTGTVPPGGNGLFSAVEQAMLGNHPPERRTQVFALYGFLGSGAMAAGALSAAVPDVLAAHGVPLMTAFRLMMALYAVLGLAMGWLAASLTPAVEAPPAVERVRAAAARPSLFGLGRSHRIMVQMASLFVADAFGTALVTTTLLVYWLHARFGLGAAHLAFLFAGTQVLAAISMLLATALARRIGLINTAVWTHIPASVFLMAVPLMPSAAPAVALLLARALLAQMDVPTRQAYIASVVDPDERAAAAGVTTLGNQVGQLVGPAVGGVTLVAGALGTFFLAGGIKIAYDLTLWWLFRHVPPRT
jgi:MFS family permease